MDDINTHITMNRAILDLPTYESRHTKLFDSYNAKICNENLWSRLKGNMNARIAIRFCFFSWQFN